MFNNAHGGANMLQAILRLPKVKDRTGKSRSGIYDGMAEGTFPRQIRLGPRAVGWLEDEIDRWISDRVAESRNKP